MNHPSRQHNHVPPLDSGTVEYMERLFPARSPDPADTEREIWMKAGEWRAVRHMRNLLNKQDHTFGGIVI